MGAEVEVEEDIIIRDVYDGPRFKGETRKRDHSEAAAAEGKGVGDAGLWGWGDADREVVDENGKVGCPCFVPFVQFSRREASGGLEWNGVEVGHRWIDA